MAVQVGDGGGDIPDGRADGGGDGGGGLRGDAGFGIGGGDQGTGGSATQKSEARKRVAAETYHIAPPIDTSSITEDQRASLLAEYASAKNGVAVDRADALFEVF